jgi:hypothetical protein
LIPNDHEHKYILLAVIACKKETVCDDVQIDILATKGKTPPVPTKRCGLTGLAGDKQNPASSGIKMPVVIDESRKAKNHRQSDGALPGTHCGRFMSHDIGS